MSKPKSFARQFQAEVRGIVGKTGTSETTITLKDDSALTFNLERGGASPKARVRQGSAAEKLCSQIAGGMLTAKGFQLRFSDGSVAEFDLGGATTPKGM